MNITVINWFINLSVWYIINIKITMINYLWIDFQFFLWNIIYEIWEKRVYLLCNLITRHSKTTQKIYLISDGITIFISSFFCREFYLCYQWTKYLDILFSNLAKMSTIQLKKFLQIVQKNIIQNLGKKYEGRRVPVSLFKRMLYIFPTLICQERLEDKL